MGKCTLIYGSVGPLGLDDKKLGPLGARLIIGSARSKLDKCLARPPLVGVTAYFSLFY